MINMIYEVAAAECAAQIIEPFYDILSYDAMMWWSDKGYRHAAASITSMTKNSPDRDLSEFKDIQRFHLICVCDFSLPRSLDT